MKIEIDKPVIPQFVADWIESLYDEGGSKYDAIGIMFEYSSKRDKDVHDWYVDNKDAFIIAVMYDYDIQKESLYYAKIKGWELVGGLDYYWGYNMRDKDFEVIDIIGDGVCTMRMTLEEWRKLGINYTNADFEEV